MACHFPGAPDVDQFWQNLRGGVDSIRHFSEAELIEAGVEPAILRHPRYVRANGVLDRMEWFDPGFFGLSPRDAAVMDPQTRHFLECVWHAFENAGHLPEGFDGTVGVFAGAGAGRYFWQNVVRDPELMREVGYFLLRHTGNDKDFLATRASYEFDLKGPSVSIQTACSTSLVAVHYACQSLLSYECDLAVAGGVTIEQPHLTGYLYEEGEILSPDGRCRSFDHRASGTVFGSGAGVVLLRRLEDAIQDRDIIHAVVRGSAVNNDGAGKVSYLAPSVDGQIKVVTEALLVAGVDAGSIGLVEGHGTATPVGDPIEVSALTRAFRTQTDGVGYCALGSVKSNIGHLDTAAGVASLIKSVLAVKHGEIPPTVHFERPNPLMELDSSPFYVNAALKPWPSAARPRRAGVTSLGVGGTNAHIVVEEPPKREASGPSRPWQLLTLSADTAAGLEDASRGLVDFLESHPLAPLADVAYTLHTARKGFRHRRSFVCRSADEAIEILAAGRSEATSAGLGNREVAFLFAGGGAQYPNMARELYERESVFRDELDACLNHLLRSDGLDLRPLLFCDPQEVSVAARELQRPSRALPALFAVQYAQARLWMSWGIRPSAMIGHSMGEYTAACLAGVFTREAGMALVALRGRLFETIETGAMTSVNLGEKELRARLDPSLSIAALNAPEISVASGPVRAIEALEKRLSAEGVDFRRIQIDVAAHSSMLDPILPEFEEYVASLTLDAPDVPVISNLTGAVAGPELAEPGYWVRHLRGTVRFADGIGTLLRPDGPILLEVGPGRTLSTVARMHGRWSQEQPVLQSLPHPTEPEDAQAFQLRALGALWSHGAQPSWSGLWGDEVRNRIPLPGYPFQRTPHFVAPPRTGSDEAGSGATGSAVGRRADVADWFYKTAWVPTVPSAPAPGSLAGRRVLVLADEGTPGDRLADELSTEGARVVRARRRAGPASADTQATRSVRPNSPEDWKALLAELKAGDSLPEIIVHAWCLGPIGQPSDPASLEQTAFYAPLFLVQALEDVAPGHATRLIAVCTGATAMGGDDVPVPHAALLLGPVRVTPAEIKSLSARLVDAGVVPEDARRERTLLRRLRNEIAMDTPEKIIALRGPERFRESFVPAPAGPADMKASLRDGGTYLITGGLGGIGLVVAREMARSRRVNLVLVSRRPLPERAQREDWIRRHGANDKTSRAIREVAGLERLGARVVVVAADVTNHDQIARAVADARASFGELHGVVHAAGILNDGPLLTRSTTEVIEVMAPKVAGVQALDAALGEADLDFMLLFSSVSAVVGAPGQVDYAAANAFLDAYARLRTHRTGQRTIAVAWGAWRDVGMAAELAGEARYGATDSDDEATPTPLDGPLFDTALTRSDGRRAFRVRFRQGRHWMLDEHQIRGSAWVLPGSGYVELIRAAFSASHPQTPFALRDLVFVLPFRVRDGEERELEVRLEPEGSAWSVSVRGRAVGGTEPWIEHASARVVAGDSGENGSRPLGEVQGRIGAPARTMRPPHPVMNFGPRWANIVAESSAGSEALLVHQLPDAFAEDWETTVLHPAILDMATAGAQHLIPGVDTTKDLLVPAGYGQLRLHRPLSGRVTSHVALRSAEGDGKLASFDVTIYDDAGNVAVTVHDFSMVKVDAGALRHDQVESTPAWLRDAITPAEGCDALGRVLLHPCGSHVFVVPRPLDVLVREAHAQPLRARSAAVAHKLPPRVPVPVVAEALESQEAVAEAIALGSPDSEPARVVAFVAFRSGAHATVSELRRFLRSRVDKRLVPQNFVEMVALPRSADGAVAIEQLRDPFAAVDDFVAPRTPTEETVARIWSELLALERVGIHDNFLDVGGHSLVGIRVLRRIHQETGVRLEANALTMQTLEQLAADIDRAAKGAAH